MNGVRDHRPGREAADPSGLAAGLHALPARDALASAWRELVARARPSFFLGWHWIGSWLECLPPRIAPRLLRVEDHGRVVGLALVVRRTAWRHGFVRSRGLHLNSTGEDALDDIAIEHNGVLAEAGREREVLDAALRCLLEAERGWDELFIPGMRSPGLLSELDLSGLRVHTVSEGPCRYVDLAALRAAGRKHVEALGRSTRYNVKRSQREYEAVGPLALEEAATIEQARAFLARLRELHQRYWTARGEPGSFANPFFTRFHDRLVETAFGDGVVQLLRVSAGGEDLGYLYNHVDRGRVYNYQSGFQYAAGEGQHRRPGMVAHALAIEHNAALGHDTYDFLAGDSDFKRNFATAEEPMAWQVVQRSRASLRLEDALRRLRRRLARASAAEEHAAARLGAARWA
jgi:CelD/BcsL family acetyltransferase involved in cellulose biosynthesis